MKIVIAPDKFKGCLSAAKVAEAIAAGVRRAIPGAEVDLCPMADGGEGTVEAMIAATGGTARTATVTGPLPGTEVEATFGLLGDGVTAVVEMAAAAGLALFSPDQRNPLRTTTYGTGELIRAAVDAGAVRVLLGIGGSATTDGGLGCAQACGARVWIDTNPGSRSGFNIEESLPVELREPATGGDLAVFHSMTRPNVAAEIIVACDVTNPLFGPNGAACVYGPQKGADEWMVRTLDAGLERLAVRTRNMEKAKLPGAGAAGGLGFGMVAFFGATLRSGVEIVTEAVGLRDRLRGADLCITGEGRLDRQSLSGKTPVGVARVCGEVGVPCVALAGSLDVGEADVRAAGLSAAYEIADARVSVEERIRRAAELLSDAAERIVRELAR